MTNKLDKEKKYTIKEISMAWFKFTRPMYLVDSNQETSVNQLEIDYSRWLYYLISEEWKRKKPNL